MISSLNGKKGLKMALYLNLLQEAATIPLGILTFHVWFFKIFYNMHDFADCSRLFYAKPHNFWMFLRMFTIYQVLPVKLFYHFLLYFTTGKVNFKNSDPYA